MSRGYCKLCSSPFKREINKRLAAGASLGQVVEFLRSKQFSVTKTTVGNHKAHITDPKQTFVEEAQKNPAIKNVSNDEFLAAVVDAAAAKVAEDPTSITIEQGLKAVGIRESRREKSVNILMAVANYVTNRQPVEMIEGSYELLPASEPVEESLVESEA